MRQAIQLAVRAYLSERANQSFVCNFVQNNVWKTTDDISYQMWKLWIITSRRKRNFKKVISHSEPLKWAKFLVLGFNLKFNILPKMGKNFLCTVHRNLGQWHSFLCSVHRKLICPYCKILIRDETEPRHGPKILRDRDKTNSLGTSSLKTETRPRLFPVRAVLRYAIFDTFYMMLTTYNTSKVFDILPEL